MCKCTCGNHMLVDISKSVTIPVAAAGAAPSSYAVHFTGFTGAAAQPPINFVPDTGCAARMPIVHPFRVEP